MQGKIEVKIPERTIEQIALIRKIVKVKMPKAHVKNERGTAYGWVSIQGSADEFGNFTDAEQKALVELKLANGLPYKCNDALIRPEDRVFMIKLWTGQVTEADLEKRQKEALERFYD